jgi:predicted alpha/beta-hydrolase family hydrolase
MTLSTPHGTVSARLDVPDRARAVYVFAHGAGAGMDHGFMSALAQRLNALGVATLRYQFPYFEKGSRRPDPKSVLVDTVVAAVDAARETNLPVFAGGKSMGGRMTSHAAAERRLIDVKGLIFVGFPLHPAKKPGVTRATHLPDIAHPMLFLQGTRDALAEMDLITKTVSRLGTGATMHVVEGADHGFHVLKRSGRTDDEVLDELADTMLEHVVGLC